MIWNWYTIDACFLTEGWHIQNNGMFAATCIGAMLLVVLLEFLRRAGKEYDALILRQFQRHVAAQTAAARSSSTSCCSDDTPRAVLPTTVTMRVTPLQQLIRSVIHAVTFGIAYITMLLAMHFNGYVIICIIIGAGIGKFVCDWMVAKIVVDDGNTGKGGAKGIEETTVCCG